MMMAIHCHCRCTCHTLLGGRCGVVACCEQSGNKWPEFEGFEKDDPHPPAVADADETKPE